MWRCGPLLWILSAFSVIVTRTHASYNDTFAWAVTSWSDCVHQDEGALCCQCYRTRTVSCAYREAPLSIVPSFYCRKLETPRPAARTPCAPCQQDCVLSAWTEWSRCSDTCAPATRMRTRSVLVEPGRGRRRCPARAHAAQCRGLPPCDRVQRHPKYAWVTGHWTSCRQRDQTAVGPCTQGARYRTSLCVFKGVDIVADDFCSHHLTEPKPPSESACHVPCDCHMTAWSQWSECSVSCPGFKEGQRGYQTRTRSVDRRPTNGGLACDAPTDSRRCDWLTVSKCPRYEWHVMEWLPCQLVTDSNHGNLEGCGPGEQRRRVTCIRAGDSHKTPMDSVMCVQDSLLHSNESIVVKPVDQRACAVPCARDCEVGEWQNWSACTHSCGTGGVRVRQKPVLVEGQYGGRSCNHSNRLQRMDCEPTPCSWWHIGEWSTCFLEGPVQEGCGIGSQVRSTYCLSALDEVLPDYNCSHHGPKPRSPRPCRIPCPEECHVSDWSAWTPCSASCGPRGGVQHRSRSSRGLSDAGGPCVPREELRQTRSCNQKPCQEPLWQVTAWSPCRSRTGLVHCGPGTGVQNRTVHCEVDPGFHVNRSQCDTRRPHATRTCAAPCPADCKLSAWSDWTACSATCGMEAERIKFRRVTQPALWGGRECPSDADIDGVILKRRPCKKVPDCRKLHWVTSGHHVCRPTTTTNGAPTCGRGKLHFNVTCTENDDRPVTDAACHEMGVGEAPPTQRPCYVPCEGDCHLGPWSDFSPCTRSCGTDPGTRTRTRNITFKVPSVEVSVQCPHLTDGDLTQIAPCSPAPCPTFYWQVGQWGTCIPFQDVDDADCGPGTQRRHVFCRRPPRGAYAASSQCDALGPMPDRQQACTAPCPAHCSMAAWGAWTNCSQTCGLGVQTRARAVVQVTAHRGRPCPHDQETTTCELYDCSDLQWSTSEWTPCSPHWGMPCGHGGQSRTLTCPAGGAEQCGAPPIDRRECHVPCLGDCVLSMWGQWTTCDCSAPNATRVRRREVVTDPVPSGVPCEPFTETQPCGCHDYQLMIGAWVSCLVGEGRQECGQGVRSRAVNCIRDDGALVSLSFCHQGDLAFSEGCALHCPRDCTVGDFSPWSPCGATCGINATRTRSRGVVDPGNAWGRPCPLPGDMIQTSLCHSVPCHSYRWQRGGWGACGVPEGRCGVGVRTRPMHCVREDGTHMESVAPCMRQDNLTWFDNQPLSHMTDSRRHDLDLHTEVECGEPCPGDCVVSSWSDFGPCYQQCTGTEPMPGVKVRSRAIIMEATGGKACPDNLLEFRLCVGEPAACPFFSWHTGMWNNRDRRPVYCTGPDGAEVSVGCHGDVRPSRQRECQRECGDHATCEDGACRCQHGLTGYGVEDCLPEFGCLSSSHCVLNGTYCDRGNKKCLCHDGTLPTNELRCPPVAGASAENGDMSDVFMFVLVGCLVALLVLALLATVLISRRRPRKHSVHKTSPCQPPLTLKSLNKCSTTPPLQSPIMGASTSPLLAGTRSTPTTPRAPRSTRFSPYTPHRHANSYNVAKYNTVSSRPDDGRYGAVPQCNNNHHGNLWQGMDVVDNHKMSLPREAGVDGAATPRGGYHSYRVTRYQPAGPGTTIVSSGSDYGTASPHSGQEDGDQFSDSLSNCTTLPATQSPLCTPRTPGGGETISSPHQGVPPSPPILRNRSNNGLSRTTSLSGSQRGPKSVRISPPQSHRVTPPDTLVRGDPHNPGTVRGKPGTPPKHRNHIPSVPVLPVTKLPQSRPRTPVAMVTASHEPDWPPPPLDLPTPPPTPQERSRSQSPPPHSPATPPPAWTRVDSPPAPTWPRTVTPGSPTLMAYSRTPPTRPPPPPPPPNIDLDADLFKDLDDEEDQLLVGSSDTESRASSRPGSPKKRLPGFATMERRAEQYRGGSDVGRDSNVSPAPTPSSGGGDKDPFLFRPGSGIGGESLPQIAERQHLLPGGDPERVWVAPNNLNQPYSSLRKPRAPQVPTRVSSTTDVPMAANTPDSRNVTGTPPHMYENLQPTANHVTPPNVRATPPPRSPSQQQRYPQNYPPSVSPTPYRTRAVSPQNVQELEDVLADLHAQC